MNNGHSKWPAAFFFTGSNWELSRKQAILITSRLVGDIGTIQRSIMTVPSTGEGFFDEWSRWIRARILAVGHGEDYHEAFNGTQALCGIVANRHLGRVARKQRCLSSAAEEGVGASCRP